MPDTGTPPPVPPEFQIYDSYAEDPKWQRNFSIIWVSLVGVAIFASLPHLVHSVRNGRAFSGLFGIWEHFPGAKYTPMLTEESTPSRAPRKLSRIEVIRSIRLWSPPGLALNAGQILVILAYMVTVLVCIVLGAPLSSNANRPGFLALAQLPVVFLFATKNSIVSLLLGPGNGYEKLNYIHRWSGRCLFFSALLHGTLWIQNHLTWHIPILGRQKETTGVAAIGLLCAIVLFSLNPVRKYSYQAFFVIHVLAFVAFFITVCYHTKFASPWIFPPLAFYGLDLLLRLFRFRIKDAILKPIDQLTTLVHVADCDGGWQAGQHVRLRVFFFGRFFESHPFTILTAPRSISCSSDPALVLAARVDGDWTRALNEFARSEVERMKSYNNEKKIAHYPGPLVQVMLDGPYGGCGIDLGRYESVLLVAGGSGATFTLGVLDDIVGRCVRLGRRGGERTRRIEFAWCIRSFGAIKWAAPFLFDIANAAAKSSVDVHISVFVTCLCVPEDVPDIPNSTVRLVRPSVHELLLELVSPPMLRPPSVDIEKISREEKSPEQPSLRWVGLGGGVGVCASGPETMTREAQNAVARLSMSRGMELGGIAFHAELFAL